MKRRRTDRQMLQNGGRGCRRPKRLRGTPAALGMILSLMLGSAAAWAGDVEILGAQVQRAGETLNARVTLRHDDTGWDHYADAWRVETLDGTVLGTRVLLHPHVDEQPFTRGLSGISAPDVVQQVVIRARDTVHGWSPQTLTVTVSDR